VEIFRRFGTKNLPLLGDEEPGTMETEALPDTGVVSFPSIANLSLSFIAVLSNSVYKG